MFSKFLTVFLWVSAVSSISVQGSGGTGWGSGSTQPQVSGSSGGGFSGGNQGGYSKKPAPLQLVDSPQGGIGGNSGGYSDPTNYGGYADQIQGGDGGGKAVAPAPQQQQGGYSGGFSKQPIGGFNGGQQQHQQVSQGGFVDLNQAVESLLDEVQPQGGAGYQENVKQDILSKPVVQLGGFSGGNQGGYSSKPAESLIIVQQPQKQQEVGYALLQPAPVGVAVQGGGNFGGYGGQQSGPTLIGGDGGVVPQQQQGYAAKPLPVVQQGPVGGFSGGYGPKPQLVQQSQGGYSGGNEGGYAQNPVKQQQGGFSGGNGGGYAQNPVKDQQPQLGGFSQENQGGYAQNPVKQQQGGFSGGSGGGYAQNPVIQQQQPLQGGFSDGNQGSYAQNPVKQQQGFSGGNVGGYSSTNQDNYDSKPLQQPGYAVQPQPQQFGHNSPVGGWGGNSMADSGRGNGWGSRQQSGFSGGNRRALWAQQSRPQHQPQIGKGSGEIQFAIISVETVPAYGKAVGGGSRGGGSGGWGWRSSGGYRASRSLGTSQGIEIR